MMRYLRLFDPVTQTIILLNVLAYAYNFYINGMNAITGISSIEEAKNIGAISGDAPIWNYLMAMFSHNSLSHFMLNMISVAFLGSIMSKMFGGQTYIMSYMASGLLGNVMSGVLNPNIFTVGASGAIFGIIGMLLVGVFTKPEYNTLRTSIIILLAVNLYYTFIGTGHETISQVGHMSGLTTGLAIGIVGWLLNRQRV